jgi:O-antigen/teichoic acid export membrane protein
MSICGYEFFRLWLGAEFAAKTFYIVIIQAVTFGAMAIGIVAWQIMEGLGNTRNNAIVSIPWAALSLILMLALIPYFRLEGVGLGRMLGCVALLIYILYVEKKVFGKILGKFWRQILLLSFLPILIAAAVEYVSLRYFLSGWIGLFLACGSGGAVFLGALFVTNYLNFDDRLFLRKLVGKFVPGFS